MVRGRERVCLSLGKKEKKRDKGHASVAQIPTKTPDKTYHIFGAHKDMKIQSDLMIMYIYVLLK